MPPLVYRTECPLQRIDVASIVEVSRRPRCNPIWCWVTANQIYAQHETI